MRLLVRFLGFLFAAGTILFLVGVSAVAGLLWHYSKDLPDYTQLKNYEPPVMTRVHAADGTLLRYNADTQIGGKLAQIGARLVRSAAQSYVDAFFGRLRQELEGEPKASASL